MPTSFLHTFTERRNRRPWRLCKRRRRRSSESEKGGRRRWSASECFGRRLRRRLALRREGISVFAGLAAEQVPLPHEGKHLS